MKKINLPLFFVFITFCASFGWSQVTRQGTNSNEIIPVYLVAPRYFAAALATRQEGEVVIEVTISPKGDILEKKRLSGNKILMGNSLFALEKWKFNPAKDPLLSRKAQITFTYKLISRDASSADAVTTFSFSEPFRVNIVEKIPAECPF